MFLWNAFHQAKKREAAEKAEQPPLASNPMTDTFQETLDRAYRGAPDPARAVNPAQAVADYIKEEAAKEIPTPSLNGQIFAAQHAVTQLELERRHAAEAARTFDATHGDGKQKAGPPARYAAIQISTQSGYDRKFKSQERDIAFRIEHAMAIVTEANGDVTMLSINHIRWIELSAS